MRGARESSPAYNAQAVTTEDQIIVAPEIATEGGDFRQLDPMITAAERELATAAVDANPGAVLADAGYWSNDHIDSLRGAASSRSSPPTPLGTGRARPGSAGPMTSCAGCFASEVGGELYSKRQCMVKPVFAQIKTNRRIDRFKRRGRAAACSEWRLIELLRVHRCDRGSDWRRSDQSDRAHERGRDPALVARHIFVP